MRALILVFALLLAGCTAIGHKPSPADWPRLEIVDHRLSNWELMKTCYAAVPFWMKLLGGVSTACAWVDLSKMQCHVYVHEQSDENDPLYVHELEHCEGKDHFGDSTLADHWENWKRAMTAGGAVYWYVRHDGELVRATP